LSQFLSDVDTTNKYHAGYMYRDHMDLAQFNTNGEDIYTG